MKYIVTTQYLENYGISVAGTSDIWKYKGGTTYIVDAPRDASAIAYVQFTLLKGETSYVTNCKEVEDSVADSFEASQEDWDKPVRATAFFPKVAEEQN